MFSNNKTLARLKAEKESTLLKLSVLQGVVDYQEKKEVAFYMALELLHSEDFRGKFSEEEISDIAIEARVVSKYYGSKFNPERLQQSIDFLRNKWMVVFDKKVEDCNFNISKYFKKD